MVRQVPEYPEFLLDDAMAFAGASTQSTDIDDSHGAALRDDSLGRQKLKTSGRALPEVSGGLTSVLLLTVEAIRSEQEKYT